MGKRKQVVPQRRSELSTINLLQASEFKAVEDQTVISKAKKNKKTTCENYTFPNEETENFFNFCLNSCHLFLKLHIFSELQTNLKGIRLIPIGHLKVQLLNCEQNLRAQEIGLPSSEIIYWYVSNEIGCSMFYFEETVDQRDRKNGFPIKANFIQVSSDVPDIVFTALKCNLLLMQCITIDFDAGIADVYALIKETGLTKLNYPSETSQIKRNSVFIKHIMKYFYDIHEETFDSNIATIKPDIEELFNEIHKIHQKNPPDVSKDLQPAALKPFLRDYQKKSVAWMLKQETKNYQENANKLHPLFTDFQTLDGRTLYYNKYGGLLVEKRPVTSIAPSGGILADEMGLGKTVEVLSCLLLHPCPNELLTPFPDFYEVKQNNVQESDTDGRELNRTFQCICGKSYSTDFEYEIQCVMCKIWLHGECIDHEEYINDQPFLCPHCQVASEPVPSGATLIVVPLSIRYQWLEEIKKHVKENTFKVFVYEGVGRQRYISPYKLASYDIVVTTYETLCKELNYVDLPHMISSTGKKFRKPKRYMTIPSPMVAVRWWRVCLDEAQMVECTTTKTAEMASRLTAINKWCVTGTPVQKNIDDLHGLLLFLGLDPYWVQQWWCKLLYIPYLHENKQPLYETVASILWRTAKKHVINEINIPTQTEIMHWLSFSPVEEHFYRRQYGECVRDAMQQLSKWKNYSVKLNSIDRKILSRLLHPLMKLRQACCHPQAVRGEFHSINKKMMTMEELLQSLIKKGVTECEEAHRQAIAARHGLAGIYIIKEQLKDAIDNYRQVLWSVREHKNTIRTDDLQLLHCYHNLNEVLSKKPEGVASALDDDKLQEKAAEIRNRLTEKHLNFVKEAFDNWLSLKIKADNLEKQLINEEWWMEILDFVVDQDKSSLLLNKIQHDLTSIDQKGFSINDQIHSIEGLKFIVSRRLTAFISERTKILKKLKKLQGKIPSQGEIDETVSCCIRAERKHQQFKCQMCLLKKDLEEYESCLYRINQSDILDFSLNTEEGASVLRRRVGNWREGELEIMLKCIYSYLPFLYHSNPDLDQQAGLHLKLFEVYRKEFPLMSKLVFWLRDQVRVYDELNMCITRMRLPYLGEKATNYSINVVYQYELKERETRLRYEKISADNDLKKRLGQLFYLQNLAKDANPSEDSPPTQCLICLEVLKDKWAVLICGHFYCISCIYIIIKRSQGYLKCPTCRQSTHFDDINYVSMEKSGVLDDEDGVSMKINFVVIFQWSSVLEIIGQALTMNGIRYSTLSSGKQSQNNLTNFKNNPEVTVLLLPVHTGCNGLNLIEAKYVILTEPILNPAQEMQAIGRVHRIGQTMATEVHRFLIKATIEERMRLMLASATNFLVPSDRNDTMLTIGDLYQLFRDVSTEAVLEDSSSSISEPQLESDDVDNTGQSALSDMQQRCAAAALSRITEEQRTFMNWNQTTRECSTTLLQHSVTSDVGTQSGSSEVTTAGQNLNIDTTSVSLSLTHPSTSILQSQSHSMSADSLPGTSFSQI
ncbi:E3 ubiquitin-protein ligase SHPRH [Octopus bimaculoides]|uniref:E3 ubiquitin-protein ligase SHPRH n=1 Tax=Octopus bimaculoides TaxID=37653 RepID=UPI0022E02D6F|nr:E3 ubiquitin-protein ligase SHPRH [Octopus bimaculoides]